MWVAAIVSGNVENRSFLDQACDEKFFVTDVRESEFKEDRKSESSEREESPGDP